MNPIDREASRLHAALASRRRTRANELRDRVLGDVERGVKQAPKTAVSAGLLAGHGLGLALTKPGSEPARAREASGASNLLGFLARTALLRSMTLGLANGTAHGSPKETTTPNTGAEASPLPNPIENIGDPSP